MKQKKVNQKETGIYTKYFVERVDGKPLEDCIVLELADPLTHPALLQWAETVEDYGYVHLARDVRELIDDYRDSDKKEASS